VKFSLFLGQTGHQIAKNRTASNVNRWYDKKHFVSVTVSYLENIFAILLEVSSFLCAKEIKD